MIIFIRQADILREFRGQKGKDAGKKKNQEILEHVLEEVVLKS